MTTSGLFIMLLSVGSVTVLFGWCVYQVLTTPQETEKIDGVEIHTPDMDGEK